MKQSPVLSIIVPSYNMEKYLPKCLGSLVVAPELMDRLEVLVVNDGSKDRTSEIAHEFAAKWPKTFKVIDKENGQYGSCVNRGLKEAQGAFVKVLDADDSFDTENFARFLSAMIKQETDRPGYYDLFISQFDTVNEYGEVTHSTRWEWDDERGVEFSELKQHYGRIYLYHIAYRTENLRRIGYRQTEGIYYTDTEWISWPMCTVNHVYFTPYVVYKYLVGRPGQSVAKEVRIKHAAAYATILVNFADVYWRENSKWTPAAKDYLRGQFAQMASLAYGIPVYELPINEAAEKIRDLERRLKAVDEKMLILARRSMVLFSGSVRLSILRMCRLFGYRIGLGFARGYRRLRSR